MECLVHLSIRTRTFLVSKRFIYYKNITKNYETLKLFILYIYLELEDLKSISQIPIERLKFDIQV